MVVLHIIFQDLGIVNLLPIVVLLDEFECRIELGLERKGQQFLRSVFRLIAITELA